MFVLGNCKALAVMGGAEEDWVPKLSLSLHWRGDLLSNSGNSPNNWWFNDFCSVWWLFARCS